MKKSSDKSQKNQIGDFLADYHLLTSDIAARIENLEADDNEGKAKIIALLNDRINLIKEEFSKNEEPPVVKAWDFSEAKAMRTFAENASLELVPMTAEYADLYLKTRAAYDNLGSFYLRPECRTLALGEINADETFFVAVIGKSDKAYMGYVGIKDTSKALWEFAVELLPEYCKQGYGFAAVGLFLKAISEITDNRKTEFRAFVETDNIASQNLMLKLGGKLVGIYDYFFHNEANAKAYEDDCLDDITKHMTELAKELSVEPRKLLSHVLDYRICTKTTSN